MTALTQGRDAREQDQYITHGVVTSGATVYHGAAVGLAPATGTVGPLGSAATQIALGVARQTVVGDGTKKVEIRAGVWHFGNSASADAITNANIGAVCYAVDDQTAALTSATNTRPVLGIIHHVEADGTVAVFVGPQWRRS